MRLSAIQRPLIAVSRICRSMSSITAPARPKFIPLENRQDSARSSSEGFRLRLVSYNILAQVYVKSSFFPNSPSSCLKWKARSKAILESLKSFNADFLCIQELDEFDSFYKENMESHGYSSLYIQRTGQKRDGCGIFYKFNSAKLVVDEEIHYNDLVPGVVYGNGATEIDSISQLASESSLATVTTQGDHGDLSDPRVRLKRDCVGILAAFRLNGPFDHMVVVANTHLYWDPDLVDVKLAQAKYLLLRVSQFTKMVSDKYNCSPSVIVAGDFNSTPGDEVYRYLVSGDTSTDCPEGFPLQLSSLYAENGGEPAFTNCTPDFTGTLDYIFLPGTEFLNPVSLLQVPGPQSADTINGLPNHYHPSDHLPIGGEFQFLATSNVDDIKAGFTKLKLLEETEDQNS